MYSPGLSNKDKAIASQETCRRLRRRQSLRLAGYCLTLFQIIIKNGPSKTL